MSLGGAVVWLSGHWFSLLWDMEYPYKYHVCSLIEFRSKGLSMCVEYGVW